MNESMDSGLEEYRKGGIRDWRNSGLSGYRKKGGIQERRVEDRRYLEQESCWTGGMQERRYHP